MRLIIIVIALIIIAIYVSLHLKRIKRKYLAELYQGLFNCQDLKGHRFANMLHYNVMAIDKQIKKMQEADYKIEGEDEYWNNLNVLQLKFAERDGKGGKIVKDSNGNPLILKQQIKFEAAKTQLDKRHKDYIAAAKVRADKIDKMLQTTCWMWLKTISPRHLPKDITAGQLKQIEIIKRRF